MCQSRSQRSRTDAAGGKVPVPVPPPRECGGADEAARHRELLERIVETIPVLLVTWDPRLEQFALNPHAEEVLGWTTADANAGDFMAMVYPDDAYRREVAEYMHSLAPGWREWRCTTKDGREVPIDWANIRLADETMVGIGVDLRDRKAAEKALRQAKDELEHRVAERTAELWRTVQTLRAEVARRREAEQALRRRGEQLRELAGELTLAEQRERRRLAGVLHDTLQQLLVGAKFRLGDLGECAAPAAREAAEAVGAILDEAIQCSRTLTGELSPPVLHEEGLGPALQWLAAWMHNKHDLRVDIEADAEAEPGSEDTRVLMFQSARELLFNAVKHAGVDTARVRLGRRDNHVELIVSDKGAGFDPAAEPAPGQSGGFGLLSIRERLNLLGGRLDIDSAPGRGSTFVMRAPLA